MPSVIAATDHNHIEPIEYRACVECGEIQDREVMGQCTNCGQYMCIKHVCSCPIDGIDEMEAA